MSIYRILLKVVFFFSLLLCLINVNGQTIIGDIFIAEGEPTSANVILKSNNEIITYELTNTYGHYEMKLDSFNLINDTVSLEVNKYGYLPQKVDVVLINKTYNFNFVLEKSTVELEEFVVKAKTTSIKTKKDTLVYNVDSFKDGSEQVVEDVLKKLPGVEVLDNGIIQYKGKRISKLLLEGDDLFDNNYVAGSRNISSDIIDKVEALDNFSDNYLLKGIEDSDKVALNLILKKGKSDWSGNGYVGYGIENRYNIAANIVGVAKKHKNFTVLSSNNLGENNTPKDYFGNKKSQEESLLDSHYSVKFISDQVYSGILGAEKANTNTNALTFGNTNHIYKINDKLSTRFNFNFIKDDLKFERKQSTLYHFEDIDDLEVLTQENIRKKPRYLSLNTQTIWKIGKKSILEYDFRWFDEDVSTDFELLASQNQNVSTSLSSRSYFTKHALTYSNRINENQALVVDANLSSNIQPQNYTMFPALDFENDSFNLSDNLNQDISSSKVLTNVNVAFYGSGKKTQSKYLVELGNEYTKESLASNLFNSVESFSRNQAIIKYNKTYLNTSKNIIWKRIQIKPSVNVRFDYTDIKESIDSTFSKIIINPKISITSNISRFSSIFLSSDYNQKPQSINNLFGGNILTSFRNLDSNSPNYIYQESWNSMLGYVYDDLAHQFLLSLYGNFYSVKNNYILKTDIHRYYSSRKFLLRPNSNKGISFNISVQKFLDFLNATTKISTQYSILNYQNIVKNTTLRDNKGTSFYTELFLKSAWDIPFDIQNITGLQHFSSKSKVSDRISNDLLKNELKLYFNPKEKWFSSITWSYYNANLKAQESMSFLDFEVRYKANSKDWELALIGKNISNNKSYHQVNVSDYFISQRSFSLNQRYILLQMKFKF